MNSDIQKIYFQTTSFIKLLEKLPNDHHLIFKKFEKLNDEYLKIINKKNIGEKINYDVFEKLTWSFTNSLILVENKINKDYFNILLKEFHKLTKLYINICVENIISHSNQYN